eukprot:TRINITY_DN3039_c0_g1_i5.p1 TRINITY_DN3039_c0_g1~~TRINITY_DN3039_c0_g1_i5.p1  ORF type:complete len:337 (-),score=47.08 TRINITY_DN3039_c0_g1_i5:190-1200(-)
MEETCENKTEIVYKNKKEISAEQIELADTVKRVHAKLRDDMQNVNADFKQIWADHLKSEEVLKQYSESMRDLATLHWTKLEKEDVTTSRILWTRQKIHQYFYQDGLHNQCTRDRNRFERNGISNVDNSEKFNRFPSSVEDPVRLKLLDVGSCYNPFSKFSELDVTAIDIAPVYENNVYKSDFLALDISDSSQICGREVVSLAKESFQIVVFCFLLEYFPATTPRYECCAKARQLLQENGILVILTPDSCHQQRNNAIIKKWKEAFLQMGFQRVYYEKLQHFHGFVLRKLGKEQHRLALLEANLPTLESQNLHEIAAKLVIPQDFNSRKEKNSTNAE